jgi:hypothetical protein
MDVLAGMEHLQVVNLCTRASRIRAGAAAGVKDLTDIDPCVQPGDLSESSRGRPCRMPRYGLQFSTVRPKTADRPLRRLSRKAIAPG